MRVMNWNIEWMNNWFVGNGRVEWRSTHTGIADVSNLAQRVANVITEIDPGVITIQEGPSDPREMRLFVTDFLSDQHNQPLYEVFGGLDGGSQKVYGLIKRSGDYQNPRLANDPITNQLFEEWLADIDGNAILEPYEYTREPLIIEGEESSTNETIRIVSLHTKSKYVNRQESLWRNPNRRQEFIIAALKNRRRISTEAMHTRLYLDELYNNNANFSVIVTGDFNDGPGIDYFEKNYLTHSVADILLGNSYRFENQYIHVLIRNVPADHLYTAIFDDFIDDNNNRPLLLDHIIVSPSLSNRFSNPRIAHTEYEAQENTSRPQGDRDRFPSDHRPVVVEIF